MNAVSSRKQNTICSSLRHRVGATGLSRWPVRRILTTGIGVMLCAVITVAPAYGWGRDGHRIIGDIASRLLTDTTARAVRALLGESSLADVSTWADEVRSKPGYEWSAPLHYVNIPRDADGFDIHRDCPEKGCVVSAIVKYTAILGDATASKTDRAEALKFIVHFVGDVHQPLHAGLASDRGGNDIRVLFMGQPRNLHEVWDTSLIAHINKPWRTYAEEMSARITPALRRDLHNTDPAAWAWESFRLAISHAYDIPESRQLDEDYVIRNRPIVEQRLLAAGVRLADLLNATLDPVMGKHSETDIVTNLPSRMPFPLPGTRCRPR